MNLRNLCVSKKSEKYTLEFFQEKLLLSSHQEFKNNHNILKETEFWEGF